MRAKSILTLILLFSAITLAEAATQKVLHTFTGGLDGGQPYADGGEVTSGVILDAAGNLYGTTLYGGTYGQGVYQIVP